MNDKLQRYSRQMMLPEIGSEGQRRLGQASVLCIGAGGLGCAALPYLAGAGVGRIVIVDHDRIERDNLQRQVLYGEMDLGQPKAEVAARRLRELNPDITVDAVAERLTAGNVERLFAASDLVIDGSDNYPTKYLAGDASVKFDVPLVYGSATGMEAMVTLFVPGQGPCLRCLFPEAPRGWVPNCNEAGVLGPLVGMAGAVQAIEAIKWLANGLEQGSLIGRLWLADARDLSMRSLAIRQRSDCPTCSRHPASIELVEAGPAIVEISYDEAIAMDGATLIDVREADEFAAGHIPGAVNLPLSTIEQGTPDRLPRGTLVCYCQTGPRAEAAAAHLARRGVGDIYCLRGSLSAWQGTPAVDR
jgi:sulfur-carrier protein adenylyltransferase/sulfurtransferase